MPKLLIGNRPECQLPFGDYQPVARLSKMENGGVQLSLKKCDINQLVSDVHSQFTSPAELKGISVMLDLPEGEDLCFGRS